MKSVFFGTSEFAVPSLLAAAAITEIVAVVTQPDRPSGRGHKLTPTPVARAAREHGFPLATPATLRAYAAELAALEPEIAIVASYGRILPQAILDVPRSGVAFNVHPSLLPLYRGATPLQSAIRDGQHETGVSIIAMDAGMDTGDILLQERTTLGSAETYGELHDRLAQRGAALLTDAIRALAAGCLERRPQASFGVSDAEIAATATRPLEKDDYAADFAWPARRIVDLVRSLAPVPLARAVIDGEPLKLGAARLAADGETEPTADDGCIVRAGDGCGVVLLRVTPPNRAPMSGAAFRRLRATA